jgi:hypothetical protein
MVTVKRKDKSFGGSLEHDWYPEKYNILQGYMSVCQVTKFVYRMFAVFEEETMYGRKECR